MLMRNRAETCPYCHKRREVTVNLDSKQVTVVLMSPTCRYGAKCMEEVRDKALLAPFEDGKVRQR
jgi:hypothetical protein